MPRSGGHPQPPTIDDAVRKHYVRWFDLTAGRSRRPSAVRASSPPPSAGHYNRHAAAESPDAPEARPRRGGRRDAVGRSACRHGAGRLQGAGPSGERPGGRAGGVVALRPTGQPHVSGGLRGEAADQLRAPGGKLNAGPGVSGMLWLTRPGAKLIDHIDAETGDLLGQIPFPVVRSHGLFWDERDGTLSVAETNGGHVYRLDPKSGAVLDEWRIAGIEVHGMTRSADGRIWIGDASTNEISVVEP